VVHGKVGSMLLRFAHGPQTVRIGDLEVRRLGFGTARLFGHRDHIDVAAMHAVLRRAVELGVNFIDTAWYYSVNELIAEALHPYPRDLVIATKVGVQQLPDHGLLPALRPDEITETVEHDLRTLRLEQLPVVHLRWIEQPEISLEEALDVLVSLQQQGKVRHIALSAVTRTLLERAERRAKIVGVQNLFNLRREPRNRADAIQELLLACEQRGIPFVPFFPLATGTLAAGGGALDAAAQRILCTPAQLAIAWLLARSPAMLPIPGTSRVVHLEENVGAIHIALDEHIISELAPNAAA
jgi:aryl-alcohol dehydrogenase-like predicted oxidoreductase